MIVQFLNDQGCEPTECAERLALSLQDVLGKLHPTPRSEVPLYTRQISLRLDDEMHDRVLAIAARSKRNQGEVLRELIEWGLEACA